MPSRLDPPRVVLSTWGRYRHATSRTLEAWARLLPTEGIVPVVTVGGHGPLSDALRAADVMIRVRPLNVVPSRLWPIPFLYAAGRLAATVRTTGATLLHVNEHDSQIVAAQAASWAKVPILTHLRFRPGPEACRWLFGRGRAPRRLFFTSQTQMQDSADAIRPLVPEERWRLLPNGLDFSLFGNARAGRENVRQQLGLNDGTLALGIACAIAPRKRVDHFVRLVARLRARGIDARGFVAGRARSAGDEGLVASLQRMAVDEGVGDHVAFLGYVEPLEPLYYAWDLCVSTSEYETFGMTVLEAMGCSCPVVAYPGGSVVEVVGETAPVVPDADEDGLLEECARLAGDADLRRSLGRRARARAESMYDIRAGVRRLAAEYREVTGLASG